MKTKDIQYISPDLFAPKDAWDALSLAAKSETMKVAVRNGITDLKTIREKYNEFAEGGDTKWTMEDEDKYMEWRQSLPDNLRLTNDNDYDMRAAFKAGMQPILEADGLYHLGSRDPETGRIFKSPHHPTYLQAINTDARMGYYPRVDNKGQTYTQTWEGNKFASKVLAHPENYSLTMRKKANFARNARHWKHGLGGNLFSGEEEGSQQMNKANIFRRPNGEYFYQAFPDSEEITVNPLNTMFENPALWTYTDAHGKVYSPRQTAITNQGVITEKENEGPIVEAAKNYLGELQYDINNGIPIGGKYTLPAIAAAAALPVVGKVAAPTVFSSLTPGSSFWMNPITQRMVAGAGMANGFDAAANMVGGYSSWGEGVSDVVNQATGLNPQDSWWGQFLAESTNPGWQFGSTRFGWDLLPFPIVPSKGSVQMNHGRNFGPFEPENWNNWGSESLTQLTNKYAVKVPKQSKTSVDVGPKSYDDMGWRYIRGVNKKLAANKIPGFEPYEYIGYHTTKDGYVPVFRQKKLTVADARTPEGIRFNEEAMADIKKEMASHSGLWKSWGVGDYGLGHNIGKNAEGIGKMYDANYTREPLTWFFQNFPRKWEISPVGSSRLIGSSLTEATDE